MSLPSAVKRDTTGKFVNFGKPGGRWNVGLSGERAA